jgi:hypothetical protein
MKFNGFYLVLCYCLNVLGAINHKPNSLVLSKPSTKTSNSTDGIFSRMGTKDDYILTYYGIMLAGAVARSVSATAVHPLNVVKTMLQRRGGQFPELSWGVLTRGAGSQFLFSIPHGALNFAVTEVCQSSSLILFPHNYA